MNRVLSPSDIDDIEQLRARLIIAEKKLSDKQLLIEKLEQTIADLAQRHWGRSSERHPGQGELSLFNEAELAAMNAPLDEHGEDESESCDSTSGDESEVSNNSAANPPKKTRRKRVLPDHLERVRVTHELDEEHLHGLCGKQRVVIGEEITEQIGVIPAKQFVIQHVKIKYACPCKQCGVLTATMPALPLPGSQASPSVLAYTMVAKFLDGLPLYRQQQMWAREGLELNRAKLARWLIDSSELLQPLYNLMQEMLFSYDIVMSDDTGIHVLKEDGRSPSSRSALWIRRGGPPDKPVVLLDYDVSKGSAVASRLLDQCHGSLVVDAAPSFNAIVAKNELDVVYCNDHSRRKFVDAERRDPNAKKERKSKNTQMWVATKAIAFYKRLYQLEKRIRELTPEQKHQARQREAVPIWETFMQWAKQVQTLGVRHAKSRMALGYLIKHEKGLRQYCEDGRLPISNILTEHVAKTVAVARKNFMFADTPAGATASALIFSILESAKANQHNPLHYMTAVLAGIPNATSLEDIEALLPWNLTPQQAAVLYHDQPSPVQIIPE
jgi:transposase